MAGTVDESILVRTCAPLYASFALESLANFLLGCTFCYLVLLIACKNQLENPGRAALTWAAEHIGWAYNDWYEMMRTWTTMPEKPLDQRMAFCRKLNLGICITQVMSSFLSITRWLHFGNINGFRYLGYSVTCPLLQAELVILIAPYIPLFKTNVIGVMLVTFATMITGWTGSLQPGPLYEDESLQNFWQSGDFQDILWTTKAYIIMPAWICLGILIFIQIPLLALIFVCKTRLQPHRDLPYHFLRLLLLVELTWPCFGIWWFLSSEGESVIHDTKANTFGFCFLNMCSKGGFTVMMLKLSRDHRRMWIEDCAVTPRANNEDLWIVRKLRPYDPAVQQEKKYTEADLDAAVARVLANRGSVQQAPSPFGFTDLADSPAPTELLPVDIPEASEKAVKGPSAKAQSDSLPMATSSAPMPVLLSASHNQEVKPGVKPVSQAQDYWLCSCERKPPVNVQTIEAPAQL